MEWIFFFYISDTHMYVCVCNKMFSLHSLSIKQKKKNEEVQVGAETYLK